MRLDDLAERIARLVLNALPPNQQVKVEIMPSPARASPRQASSLALVLNELTTNTAKHAIGERAMVRIGVRIALEGNEVILEYRDDGPGYPEEVLGLERCNVGLYLIQRMVCHTLGGTLTLANDGGAIAAIRVGVEGESVT